jgi:DNA-binding transcriptional MerR regulator
MTDFLTIKEIAKHFQVPESNIRYYRDRFEEYIPSIGEGRKKRYKKEALDVFAHIVHGYREEKSTEQIASELGSLFPRNVHVNHSESPVEESRDLATPEQYAGSSSYLVLQAQSRTLEHLAQALARNSSLSSEFSRLRQEQEKLKKGLMHVWRTQKSGSEHDPGIKNAEIHSMVHQLRSLEERIEDLERYLEQELSQVREDMKECLNLTRELVQSSVNNA